MSRADGPVLAEMRLYGPVVTVGSYMVVEDSNVHGHPVNLAHGPGPMEAIQAFMREDDHFVVDRSREKLLMTFDPSGYLRRTRA